MKRWSIKNKKNEKRWKIKKYIYKKVVTLAKFKDVSGKRRPVSSLAWQKVLSIIIIIILIIINILIMAYTQNSYGEYSYS